MLDMRCFLLMIFLAVFASPARSQWVIQESHTSASFRGIHSLGGGVVWVSGTNGTVLRTQDGGEHWLACAIPPGGDQLDFRGIQAFDFNTAIVMSSGNGDLSRLYKTTDGCLTWKLLLSNPYAPGGFFDAILFLDRLHGLLLGDPSPQNRNTPVEYDNDFRLRVTADGGITWGPVTAPEWQPREGDGLHKAGEEGAFAASNSSMAFSNGWFWFATSSARVASRRLYETPQPPPLFFHAAICGGNIDPASRECGQPWTDFRNSQAPLNHAVPSAGIFSLKFRNATQGVAVGGDYQKPDDPSGTAAYTDDGGMHWFAAHTPPGGYRSSVDYDPSTGNWIAVGPNGTDVSSDEGDNWRPLRPDPALNESADADRKWNALSLPFVAGPRGRIGKLSPSALRPQ